MKTGFISETEFLQEMNQQWRHFGNSVDENGLASPAFQECWRTILQSFNNQLAGQRGLHVCDSVCGSGKTLAAEVASVILSKNWEDVGTLIVVRLTEQCIDVKDRINEISMRLIGKPIAKSMFSRHTTANGEHLSGYLSKDEVAETQCIVITHANYLKTISGNKKDLFSKWKRGKRQFRVVDESLDLVEQFHLSNEEMFRIGSFLKMRNKYWEFYPKWKNHMDLYRDIEEFFLMHPKEGIISEEFKQMIDSHAVDGNPIYFSELCDEVNDSTSKDYGKRFKEGEFEQEQEAVTTGLDVLDRMMRRVLYFWTDRENKKTYSTAEVILPNQFDSLCVLDATSNVDKVYDLFQQREQITRYEVNRDVRNFQYLNINIRPDKKLGKPSNKSDALSRAKKIVKWALKHFKSTDKVLFAGHKSGTEPLIKLLKEANPSFEWDVCWWNAIDGRNTWRDFNNLVVFSMLYLPPSYNALTKIGFHSTINPLVQLGTDDSSISDSSIAVKVIQLIARIRARMVANLQGDCEPTNVFLLLPGNTPTKDTQLFKHRLDKLGRFLLHEIETSMNKVVIQNWTSFQGFSKPKQDSDDDCYKQDKFIAWLDEQLQTRDCVDLKEYASVVGTEALASIKPLFNDKRNYESRINQHLRSESITKTRTLGRYGTTTFTKEI